MKIKKTSAERTQKKKINKKSDEKKSKKRVLVNKNLNKKTGKNKLKRHKKEYEMEADSSEQEDDDSSCIYCGYLCSESTEGWVICRVCHGWAHNSCAGVDEDDNEAHTCERCQPH